MMLVNVLAIVSAQAHSDALTRIQQFYVPDFNAKNIKVSDDISSTTEQSSGINVFLNASHSEQYFPQTLSEHNTDFCSGQWVIPTEHSEQQGVPTTHASQQPLHVLADRAYYDNQRFAYITGNVAVQQGQRTLYSDSLVLDLVAQVAAVSGEVLLTSQDDLGLALAADTINYTTDSEALTAYDVAFVSTMLQTHGFAKRLNRPNLHQLTLENARYTRCPPDKPAWHIAADTLSVDQHTGRGQVYGGMLYVRDIPVAYLPYFNFPIDNRRQTGFLLPKAGLSEDGGFFSTLPFYFNLNNAYDLTVATTLYTERTPRLSANFRYLTQNFGYGELDASYLADDGLYDNQDRHSLFYQHRWQSIGYPELSASLDYNYVSDVDFLSDFEVNTGVLDSEQDYFNDDNPLNLVQQATIAYNTDQLELALQIKDYLTVNRDIADVFKPYASLPSLTFNYQWQPWHGLDISTTNQATYFKKSIEDGSAFEKSGLRLYEALSFKYPLANDYAYVIPEAHFRHLHFQFDRESIDAQGLTVGQDDHDSVFVPEVNIAAGLKFTKPTLPTFVEELIQSDWQLPSTLKNTPTTRYDYQLPTTLSGYQVIEPKLFYTYAPYKAQDRLPNFSSDTAPLTFDQLFSSHRFVGYDRLTDANALSLGLTYRMVSKSGLDLLKAGIAQRFYLDDYEVQLANAQGTRPRPIAINTNQPPLEKTDDKDSGIILQLSSQLGQNVYAFNETGLTPNEQLSFTNTYLDWYPYPDWLLHLGIVNRNADLNTGQYEFSAINASAYVPITPQWHVIAHTQYDLDNQQSQDLMIGLDYNNCCYRIAIYGRSSLNELKQNNLFTIGHQDNQRRRRIMAELELKGVSSSLNKLRRFMRNRFLVAK